MGSRIAPDRLWLAGAGRGLPSLVAEVGDTLPSNRSVVNWTSVPVQVTRIGWAIAATGAWRRRALDSHGRKCSTHSHLTVLLFSGAYCDLGRSDRYYQGSKHLNRLDRLETRAGPILCWLFEAFSFE